jgi:hypothetical protein
MIVYVIKNIVLMEVAFVSIHCVTTALKLLTKRQPFNYIFTYLPTCGSKELVTIGSNLDRVRFLYNPDVKS